MSVREDGNLTPKQKAPCEEKATQEADKDYLRHLTLQKRQLQTITQNAMLLALCLVFGWVESLLPPPSPVPVKYGLSNIPLMFALFTSSFPSALLLAFLKSLFALSTRGGIAGLLSLSGGLASLAVMNLLYRLPKRQVSWILISSFGALSHNLAQFFIVVLLYHESGSALFYSLLPVLILFGIGAGVLTGLVLKALFPALKKLREW